MEVCVDSKLKFGSFFVTALFKVNWHICFRQGSSRFPIKLCLVQMFNEYLQK